MITRIKTWLYITIFKLFTFRGCHRDLSPRPGRQQPVAVTHHLHHGHDIIPRYFSVSVFHNRLHLLYNVISSFYSIYILRCKNKKHGLYNFDIWTSSISGRHFQNGVGEKKKVQTQHVDNKQETTYSDFKK